MTTTGPAPPLILIAASAEHSLASVFAGRHYTVVQVHTGTLALECVAASTGNEDDRWKLSFELRGAEVPGSDPAPGPSKDSGRSQSL